jgi:hypothetical protein
MCPREYQRRAVADGTVLAGGVTHISTAQRGDTQVEQTANCRSRSSANRCCRLPRHIRVDVPSRLLRTRGRLVGPPRSGSVHLVSVTRETACVSLWLQVV